MTLIISFIFCLHSESRVHLDKNYKQGGNGIPEIESLGLDIFEISFIIFVLLLGCCLGFIFVLPIE